jgi:hypothetical protein
MKYAKLSVQEIEILKNLENDFNKRTNLNISLLAAENQ